ncbi:Ig-like domain-containing protein [Stigmatella sp. ncwal1]|uniref:Ig-like domain-containing protein n=1 Tax=Stigmatella ashevillensis TaxID=2995309 RepID=A0ABT5DC24_9BACT|nr:Ig-like domain-containing protein [Stigmatella ashevillena]MDC0711169.1 Ig-like domain-containing protein [Stigmatella ashevillena]
MKQWHCVTLVFLGVSFLSALAGPDSLGGGSDRYGALKERSAGTANGRHAQGEGASVPEDFDGGEWADLEDPPLKIKVTEAQDRPIPQPGSENQGNVWVNASLKLKLEGFATLGSTVKVKVNTRVARSDIAVSGPVNDEGLGSWIVEIGYPEEDGGVTEFIEGQCYNIEVTANKVGPPSEISSPAFASVRVDNTAPNLVLNTDNVPPSPTNKTEATFVFSASDSIQSVCACSGGTCGNLAVTQCTVDGGFSLCSANTSIKVAVDTGPQLFRVQAIDWAGNLKEVSWPWTVDLAKPSVVIETSLGALTKSKTAVFDFVATDNHVGPVVQCAMDRAQLSDSDLCPSHHEILNVQDGDHRIYVRAKDVAGNYSGVVNHFWRVDSTPPNITINGKPDKDSRLNEAVFTFSSSSPGDVHAVHCALNPKDEKPTEGEFRPCSSSMEDRFPIGEGPHRFVVRARDAAGNESVLDEYSWTVDFAPPSVSIDSSPRELDNSADAVFTFSSEDVDWAKFQCSLAKDGGFFDCNSGQSHRVPDGPRIFRVRAVDKAGNIGTVATYDWVVDTMPPVVSIMFPDALESTRTPLIRGTTEPRSAVRISIGDVLLPDIKAADNGQWTTLSSDLGTDKEYVVSVSAVDEAGNSSGPPVTKPFVVDTKPPTTTIVARPDKVSKDRVAKFEFTASEEGVTYQCNLDKKTFVDCNKTHVTEALLRGPHTLQVKARDKARNEELTPVSWDWEVHVGAPLYPDIAQPADGSEVNTGTPVISGTADPNGVVTVLIDGASHGTASVGVDGTWTFRPGNRLEEGSHSLSGRFTDKDNVNSEEDSPVVHFKVLLPKETGTLSGGAGCSASGLDVAAGAASFWSLLALLGFSRRRRS